MVNISAFADEISPDLDEQIAVLLGEKIHYIDLRGMWGTNVLDLTDGQLSEIRARLNDAGMGVSTIGSPIGKVAIDSSFDEHIHRFERAITVARFFNTPYIRIFSFYPPGGPTPGADMAPYRDVVLHHLHELTARARAADITLLHENEKGIYGDTIARCVDLLQSIADPNFAAILDPANFIQCGETPFPDAYEAIVPWLRNVHVKDALADGTVVAAGEGIATWPSLLLRLRESGYNGFLSLEPHLAEGAMFGGFSGPDRFRHAARSLQGLLRAQDWKYA
ncbi:MAG: Xylose isomerase domain protein barrel [Chloroflexi bacterium]|jgi:3-dehydroshikimate dehydratase|nr:Xylose isomerase domain protein barrel [Chloroflexota bacterium]